MNKPKPKTIENRWDLLYQDYPDVYDAFVSIPKTPSMVEVLNHHFPMAGKTILDIGSGSGDSTFQFSPLAKHVIGLEIEDAMRAIAEIKAKQNQIKNVTFIKGSATEMSLANQSVDYSIAITLPLFIKDEIRAYINEALRVTKQNGYVINLGIAPKKYGGDLAKVILGDSEITEEDTEGVVDDILVNEYGFDFFDYEAIQDYKSIDRIVSTYGFIFGQNAIDYLIEHQKTSIVWTYRVHYKKVG